MANKQENALAEIHELDPSEIGVFTTIVNKGDAVYGTLRIGQQVFTLDDREEAEGTEILHYVQV